MTQAQKYMINYLMYFIPKMQNIYFIAKDIFILWYLNKILLGIKYFLLNILYVFFLLAYIYK